MTKKNEIYKCPTCGNIVEVLHVGAGELVCCGKPMELMTENTVDAAKEKHVPVVKVDGNKVSVEVGSVPHPMEPEHYITFIYLETSKGAQKKFLKPGEAAKADFLTEGEEAVAVYEYCNLHGLWKTTL